MAESNCRLEIIVQPQEFLRFRTLKDPFHGELKGINNEEITVGLKGYTGSQNDVIVLCTIYHSDYPHPNRLLKPDEENGEVLLEIKNIEHRVTLDPIISDLNNWRATFSKMVIIRTKREEISLALHDKLMRIRTYKPDYLINREINIAEINFDMNNIQLCFEAFVKNGEQYQSICAPTFSNNIRYDADQVEGFVWYCMEETCFGKTAGNDKFIILCKYQKGIKNINVRFYEKINDKIDWEANAVKIKQEKTFGNHNLIITTPAYKEIEILNDKPVLFELRGYINGNEIVSDAKKFIYKATDKLIEIGKKRKVVNDKIDEVIIGLINKLDKENTAKENIKIMCKDYLVKIFPPNDLIFPPGMLAGASDGIAMRLDANTMEPFTSTQISEQHIKLLTELKENNILHKLIRENEKDKLNQFFKVISDNNLEEIFQLQDDNGDTCLHVACYFSQVDYIEKLLKPDIDPNIQNNEGDTAMHIAVEKNHDECVFRILLFSKNLNLEVTNDKGYTPLYLAFLLEHYLIVEQLINFKESLSMFQHQSNGNTILHLAVEQMNEDMVKLLLDKTPIHKNIENQCGMTALALAIEINAENIIQLLID